MTHQEIVDKIQALKDALPNKVDAVKVAHDLEIEALRLECAKIGHILSGWLHRCVVCDDGEKGCVIVMPLPINTNGRAHKKLA